MIVDASVLLFRERGGFVKANGEDYTAGLYSITLPGNASTLSVRDNFLLEICATPNSKSESADSSAPPRLRPSIPGRV